MHQDANDNNGNDQQQEVEMHQDANDNNGNDQQQEVEMNQEQMHRNIWMLQNKWRF